MVVALFDEQPLVAFAPRAAGAYADDGEVSVKLFAIEAELEVALGQHLSGLFICSRKELSIDWRGREWLPLSDVPDHNRTRAVVAFGNDAFEAEIGNGVIFDLHGEALVVGIERGTFGDGPGF